jgi:hypothetical protein
MGATHQKGKIRQYRDSESQGKKCGKKEGEVLCQAAEIKVRIAH